jgi:predicted RNA-binding Zn-ribbon protein involved in translation (DUF1610 family)
MEETYVRLLCPSCNKDWESEPGALPTPDGPFDCPDCGTERPTSEFMRTEHDLRTLKNLG